MMLRIGHPGSWFALRAGSWRFGRLAYRLFLVRFGARRWSTYWRLS